MAKMKWDISGKGKGAVSGEGQYSGPLLPKGSYPAKVKRVEVVKITSNTENKNKPRLRILLEVQTAHDEDEQRRKYHGHPIWDGLNIIEGSEQFVNGFLHGLTDGSQKAKDAIESAFWDDDKGPDFKRVKNAKTGATETHIMKIGRAVINSPKGDTIVQVVTKMGEYKGQQKPEVAGYVPFDPKANPGLTNNGAEVDEDDLGDDGVDDDLDEDQDMLDAEDDDGDDDIDDDDDMDDDDDEDADDEDADEPATAGRGKKPF
jgi:hypothetical protein